MALGRHTITQQIALIRIMQCKVIKVLMVKANMTGSSTAEELISQRSSHFSGVDLFLTQTSRYRTVHGNMQGVQEAWKIEKGEIPLT